MILVATTAAPLPARRTSSAQPMVSFTYIGDGSVASQR